MADFDVEAYYAEQAERMNLPDEDADEYIKRVSSLRQRCVHTALNGEYHAKADIVKISTETRPGGCHKPHGIETQIKTRLQSQR